jgi:hypothetical protein
LVVINKLTLTHTPTTLQEKLNSLKTKKTMESISLLINDPNYSTPSVTGGRNNVAALRELKPDPNGLLLKKDGMEVDNLLQQRGLERKKVSDLCG